MEKGSNPHSKGEDFSRSVLLFFLRIEAIKIMTHAIIKIIAIIIKSEIIIFTKLRPSHWK